MFELNSMIFFLTLIPYSIICSYQDIKRRKVSNLTTLSFLFVSLCIFVFYITLYTFVDYLVIILAFAFAFLLYKYDIWGGADGKVFLGIIMILISLADSIIFTSFLLNLLFLYVIGITSIVLFKTKLENKIAVIKSIDYEFILFYLFIIFLIVKSFVRKFLIDSNPFFSLIFVIAIYILIQKSNKYLQKFYYQKKEVLRFFLVFALAITFALISDLTIWFYFMLVFILRVSTYFFSHMTTFLKDKKGQKYHTPFMLYLFLSVIISYILKENILGFLIKLFS